MGLGWTFPSPLELLGGLAVVPCEGSYLGAILARYCPSQRVVSALGDLSLLRCGFPALLGPRSAQHPLSDTTRPGRLTGPPLELPQSPSPKEVINLHESFEFPNEHRIISIEKLAASA